MSALVKSKRADVSWRRLSTAANQGLTTAAPQLRPKMAYSCIFSLQQRAIRCDYGVLGLRGNC